MPIESLSGIAPDSLTNVTEGELEEALSGIAPTDTATFTGVTTFGNGTTIDGSGNIRMSGNLLQTGGVPTEIYGGDDGTQAIELHGSTIEIDGDLVAPITDANLNSGVATDVLAALSELASRVSALEGP